MQFKPTNVEYRRRFRFLAYLQGTFGILGLFVMFTMPVFRLVFDTFEERSSYYYLGAFSLPEGATVRNPVVPNLMLDGVIFLACLVVGLVSALAVIFIRERLAIVISGLAGALAGLVMFFIGIGTRVTPLPTRGYGFQPGAAAILLAVIGVGMGLFALLAFVKREELLGLIPD